MWQPVRVCLHVLIVIAVVGSVKAFCPPQNQSVSDEPEFTRSDLASLDYVRYGHGIAVPCCAQGYENITWYKRENGTWKSFPPSGTGNYNTPKVEENGQVLRIYSAEFTDKTSYRCDVIGKSKVIQHTTELIVIACDPLARGPIQTKPFPQNQTIYEYGGNITLHCTGYFGCNDDNDIRLALWMVEGIPDFNISDVSSRYSVEISNNSEQTMKQATLTIHSVQEEDVQRTFLCDLATPQEKEGQTRMRVRIFKKDKPKTPWLEIGLIIGGCVVFVIIIISLVSTLRCLYGPQIRLYVSSRTSMFGPNTIDNENYYYNLLIYHADEDATKAQHIKDTLENHGYKVYITAEMKGNQKIIPTFFEKTAQSAMVLFLYSDDLRNDDYASFFLQSLIAEKREMDILFLEVADYKPEEIMNWAHHAKDMHELQERNLGPKELENGRNIEDNENENARSIEENDGIGDVANEDNNNEAVTEKKVAKADNLKFWKYLPRIKVPADEKNNRKTENFWCSLQNKIPKFAEQKQKFKDIRRNKKRNSSSQRPLLESDRESEAMTPLSPARNAEELSPNRDQVFTFEETNKVEHKFPRGQRWNGIQNIVSSKKETDFAIAEHNPENGPMILPPANRQTAQNEKDIVRGEFAKERDNDFVYVADVHHNENSDMQVPGNEAKPVTDIQKHFQDNISHNIEEAPQKETRMKAKEEIFTMSGEEPKTGSFDSESGYNGGNRSGRGTTYPSSESGESSRNGEPSSQSSGFSDFNSEGSVSPPNRLENAYARAHTNRQQPATYIPTDKLNGHFDRENTELMTATGTECHNVIVKPRSDMNPSSSSSPESGYNTSPSERILSNGEFLPQIKETVERGVDIVADET